MILSRGLRIGFANGKVLREWPLLAPWRDGAVLSGTVDVLVRCAEGVWVFDHKSGAVDGCDFDAAFRSHYSQIRAYVDMLESQQLTVLGAGIHWVRHGVVSLMAFQED